MQSHYSSSSSSLTSVGGSGGSGGSGGGGLAGTVVVAIPLGDEIQQPSVPGVPARSSTAFLLAYEKYRKMFEFNQQEVIKAAENSVTW